MEESFDSRYSLPVKTPNYQSTPMIMKSQTYYYPSGHRRIHSSDLEYQTPTASIHTNGDIAIESEKSPGSIKSSRKSASPVSKLAEMDSTTILRQRRELQLMITELKDRDKELNELVQSHHKQLVSWEVDRERMATLEKQMSKVKAEYRKQHEQCKVMSGKLKKYDKEIQCKSIELETAQTHLQHVSERANSSETQIEEMQVRNKTLQSSVEELSNKVGTLRAHEQQLESLLRLRDHDLKDANFRIEELTEKLKTSNGDKRSESDIRFELDKSRSENRSLKERVEKMKTSFHESQEASSDDQEEIFQLKQEVIILQKELLSTGEREKRKDSLIELARSKQERNEIELNNLRLLYDSLQRESILMKQQICNQDDKMSLFSMSEFSVKDIGSSVELNSTILLESPCTSILVSTEQEDNIHLSPISANVTGANLSNLTVQNDDAGTMTTEELRRSDESYNRAGNIQSEGNTLNDEVAPVLRLETLLSQSQQMVEELENSTSFLSINAVRDEKENLSDLEENGEL